MSNHITNGQCPREKNEEMCRYKHPQVEAIIVKISLCSNEHQCVLLKELINHFTLFTKLH